MGNHYHYHYSASHLCLTGAVDFSLHTAVQCVWEINEQRFSPLETFNLEIKNTITQQHTWVTPVSVRTDDVCSSSLQQH